MIYDKLMIYRKTRYIRRSREENHAKVVEIFEIMDSSKKTGIPTNPCHLECFELKISKPKKYLRRSRADRYKVIRISERQAWQSRGWVLDISSQEVTLSYLSRSKDDTYKFDVGTLKSPWRQNRHGEVEKKFGLLKS
jgi:hypothetical protein